MNKQGSKAFNSNQIFDRAVVVSDRAYREETMIKTIAIVVFGLALASAAQAMPFAPIHQPDTTIIQARMGCGPGRVMVNGVCVARSTIRQARRCARWTGGVCAQWY
jgi:hypothetical protein